MAGRELLTPRHMTSALAIAAQPLVPQTALVIGRNSEAESLLNDSPSAASWEILRAADNPSAFSLASTQRLGVVFTDREATAAEGIELLRALQLTQPAARVILLACNASVTEISSAIREHAYTMFARSCDAQALAEIFHLAATDLRWTDGIDLVSATREWIRARIRCDRDSADRWMQFFREWVADLPGGAGQPIGLAARELLDNAIEHGGQLDPRRFVECSVVRTSRMVACRIVDPGEGFQIGRVPHAAIDNPAADPARHVVYRQEHGMRPGGFGVLVARQSVDELLYNEKGNEALLVKYLSPA